MIGPDTVGAAVRLGGAAIRLPRAEEAWEPVLFGGMIPILGALAIFWLIRHAIKSPPPDEEQRQAEERAAAEIQAAKEEGGPEDPPA